MNNERDFIGICDNCKTDNILVHKFDMPKDLPESFYVMFPEERNIDHPDYFLLCTSCIHGIDKIDKKWK